MADEVQEAAGWSGSVARFEVIRVLHWSVSEMRGRRSGRCSLGGDGISLELFPIERNERWVARQ